MVSSQELFPWGDAWGGLFLGRKESPSRCILGQACCRGKSLAGAWELGFQEDSHHAKLRAVLTALKLDEGELHPCSPPGSLELQCAVGRGSPGGRPPLRH